MSVEETNKAIVRRFLEEIWNQGKVELEDEFSAPNRTYHDPFSGELHGVEGHRQLVIGYRTAFPDLHFDLDGIAAEGDWVVTRWTSTGTHKGDLGPIPATGKTTKGLGMNWQRLVDGKVVEEYSIWDALGMFQQLGVIPPMG